MTEFTFDVKFVTKAKVMEDFSLDMEVYKFLEEVCEKRGYSANRSHMEIVSGKMKGMLVPYEAEETFASLSVENPSDFVIICEKEE